MATKKKTTRQAKPAAVPTNGGAPRAPQRNRLQERISLFRDLLRRSQGQISMALPGNMDGTRFVRICLTSLQLTPRLLECDPLRFIGAAVQAAQLGLEPDPRLGLVHLIPFKQDVQVVLGYRGVIRLARNSGEISTVEARAVHEQDTFEYEYGLDQRLRHIPSEQPDAGKLRAAYALVRFRGTDDSQFNVVLGRDIAKAKRASKASAKADSPWNLYESAMWAKTAVRRLEPFLPLSPLARQAFALDEAADRGEKQQFTADLELPLIGGTDSPETGLDGLASEVEQEAAGGLPGVE